MRPSCPFLSRSMPSYDIHITVDAACENIASTVREQCASGLDQEKRTSIDGLISVSTTELPVHGLVEFRCAQREGRRTKHPVQPGDGAQRIVARMVVVRASDVSQAVAVGRWDAFLSSCDAVLRCDSSLQQTLERSQPVTVFLMVVSQQGLSARLAEAAATVACHSSSVTRWSWEHVSSEASIASRIISIANYFAQGNHAKQRDGGHDSRKQRKCEATDFHALYAAMLSEVSGVSSRQANNVIGTVPTMDGLLRMVCDKPPQIAALSRSLGFGEASTVGCALASQIAQALCEPFVPEASNQRLATIVTDSRKCFDVGSPAALASQRDEWWEDL